MKTLAMVLALSFLLANVSCTKWGNPDTLQDPARANSVPEEVVRQFVELSGGAKEIGDKEKLTKLCGGEMRRAFDRMSGEEFRMGYLESKLNITSIQILETSIQGDTAKVRYQVTVENKGGTEPTTEINEREVELSKTQGIWLIEFIRLKGTDKLSFTRGMIL